MSLSVCVWVQCWLQCKLIKIKCEKMQPCSSLHSSHCSSHKFPHFSCPQTDRDRDAFAFDKSRNKKNTWHGKAKLLSVLPFTCTCLVSKNKSHPSRSHSSKAIRSRSGHAFTWTPHAQRVIQTHSHTHIHTAPGRTLDSTAMWSCRSYLPACLLLLADTARERARHADVRM